MKKALIIVLLVIVAAIVGFFLYTELTVKELFFVSNFENDDERGKYSVKRLYSSDVNMDEFNEKMENMISLEFTEEEIMQAALESGTPEFYPAFHVATYRPTLNDNAVIVELGVYQELAKGQKSAEYSLSDIHLEIMTDGVTIKEATAKSTDSLGTSSEAVIIRNEAGTAISTELGDYGGTELLLDGTTGSVTIQCAYGIKKNALVKHIAMENCFVVIHVSFAEQPDGKIKVTYFCEPSTTVDEYNEQ